jgi:hypothetical protein
MNILKNFAAAMDRNIERERLYKIYLQRKAELEIENAEFFNSEKCQQQLHPLPDTLAWDADRIGPRVPDWDWDRQQAEAEGWGNQNTLEKAP